MICPTCGSEKSKVIDTAFIPTGNYRLRERVCSNEHFFLTTETAVDINDELRLRHKLSTARYMAVKARKKSNG